MEQGAVSDRLLQRVGPSQSRSMTPNTSFVFEPYGRTLLARRDAIDLDPEVRENQARTEREPVLLQYKITLLGELASLP